MSEGSNNWQQLPRYLAGECAPEERVRLEQWIQADAERRELADRLRRIWETSGASPGEPPPGEVDVVADWKKLVRKMRAQERQAPSRERRPIRRSTRRRSASSFGQIARTVVLLVLFIGGAFFAAKLWSGFSSGAPPMREIVTGPGERATIRLADGTKVILNVDSRLHLSASFSEGDVRAVSLQGEAYFDVASNAERPFVVRAGAAVVRVEGTAFNIEAYPEEHPDEPEVEVAVTEGTVVLTADASEEEEEALSVRLERGQLGRLEAGGTRVTKEQADVQAQMAWTEGRLVFNNASLPEVAVRLERWYGIECTIEEGVPRPLYLTAVLNSRAIRDVLDVVTASLGLEYRIEGDTVYLMREE